MLPRGSRRYSHAADGPKGDYRQPILACGNSRKSGRLCLVCGQQGCRRQLHGRIGEGTGTPRHPGQRGGAGIIETEIHADAGSKERLDALIRAVPMGRSAAARRWRRPYCGCCRTRPVCLGDHPTGFGRPLTDARIAHELTLVRVSAMTEGPLFLYRERRRAGGVESRSRPKLGRGKASVPA